MLTPSNHSDNNTLAAYSARAPQSVLSAIKTASTKTGVDFAYMVQQADAESAFKADAKAKTSSAKGLYQFIERTWLSMVDKHGAAHGIETDGKSRADILKLRDDPEIASFMAAELARDNKNVLDANWAKGEKEISSTELYFAHFLGAGGASAFLNARDADGAAKAAHIFPAAAKANKNVFYERGTGRAKSLDEVYAYFDRKFDLDTKIAAAAPEQSVVKAKPAKGYRPARLATADTHAYGALMNAAREESPNIAAQNITRFMNGFTMQNSVFSTAQTARSPSGFAGFNAIPLTSLISSPAEMMMLAQMETPYDGRRDDSAKRARRF